MTLVLTPASIAEDGKTSTVTATLSGAAAVTTVEVSATAVSGDFTLSQNTTLTIAAGQTSSTGEVTITSVDNGVDAPDKTVTVSGSASNAQGVSGPSNQTLTITDDDTASWTVTVDPASIAEDGGTSTVEVSTGGVTFLSDRSIALSLSGTATQDTDYTTAAESLMLPAGETSVTMTVPRCRTRWTRRPRRWW